MGKQIPQALRDKLLRRRSEMSSGDIIKNKDFTKGKFRVLPAVKANEEPGIPYIGYYCEGLGGDKKGTSSPTTFGKPCPIEAAINQLKQGGDEASADLIDAVKVTREYWLQVIDRSDPGTAAAPKIKIFCAKPSVYKQIIERMTMEDVGEDITDPVDGTDIFILKEGSGKETEWKVTFLKSCPISDDDKYAEAVLKLSKKNDVKSKMFKPNWDVLGAIHEFLTGEEIPENYKKGQAAPAAEAGESDVDGSDSESESAVEDEAAEEAASVDAEESGEEAAAEADEGTIEIEPGKTRVSFDSEGTPITGTVLEQGDDGLLHVVKDGESADKDGYYEVPVDEVTVLEDAPAPKPVVKKTPAKTTPAPQKAAPAKAAPAPAAKQGGGSNGKAAVAPRKPAAPATRASAAIAARAKAAKK